MADAAEDLYPDSRRLTPKDLPSPKPPAASTPAAPAGTAAPPPPPDFDKEMQDLLGRLDTITKNYAASSAPLRGAEIKLASEPVNVPPPPALEALPRKVAAARMAQPFQQMSPVMLFLAAAGGALTGQPITAAFNASAGYIDGILKGDAYAAHLAQQDFEDNLKSAVETNTQKLEQYHAALSSANLSIADKANRLRAIALAHGDDQTLALLEQGNIKVAVEGMAAQARSAQTLITQNLQIKRLVATSLGAPQMVTTKDGKQILAQQDKAGVLGAAGQWYTADEKHAPVQDVVAAQSASTAGNPSATEDMAKLIAQYSVPPLSGWALKSASGQQIMADVMKLNPNYNANLYPTIGKVLKDFATGQQGQRITSVNVAIQHLNVMKGLADALQSGDVRSINAARQAWEKAFGSAAPTNFDAVKQIVGQEVVKAVVQNGGGVTERANAQETFSRISSPAQMAGAIDSVEALLAGQVAGLRKQYDTLTQMAPGVIPFDQFLLPDTKRALAKIGSTSQMKPGAPTLMQWLPKARAANPGVSDEALTEFWRKKYTNAAGGQ